MASKKYAKVNTKRCVACGVCVKECPKSAIHIFKGCFAVIDKEICLGCGKCATNCPANSIEVLERERKEDIWKKPGMNIYGFGQ